MMLSSVFPCGARHHFVGRNESQARAAARFPLAILAREAAPKKNPVALHGYHALCNFPR